MKRIDGLWAYEWKGYLFRVRDGEPEFTTLGGGGAFRPLWDWDGPEMDEEIRYALMNLAKHPA